ncbi:Dematin [Fasciola gigantica]|uniref:Dematin n=1 Tax=Fasciola gigantica TaxID=46835 RepID=A0A504YF71_FASGI|nr:Dematin [Fasciola gigantica]
MEAWTHGQTVQRQRIRQNVHKAALYSRAVSLPRPVAVGAGGDTGQNESLLTTLAGAESQQLTHDRIASLATSALSVDGLTVCSGDDTGTLGPSGGTYCIKSGTMTGLPPSVTGLRPISSMLKQCSLTTRHRSRTQTPVRHAGAYGVSDSEILDVDSYPSVQSWLRPSSQKKMSFKTYPYEQLRSSATQPIKGIDQTRLENYLSLDEFESLFRMPLSAFQRLPNGSDFDLKKRLELFEHSHFHNPTRCHRIQNIVSLRFILLCL